MKVSFREDITILMTELYSLSRNGSHFAFLFLAYFLNIWLDIIDFSPNCFTSAEDIERYGIFCYLLCKFNQEITVMLCMLISCFFLLLNVLQFQYALIVYKYIAIYPHRKLSGFLAQN
ncbi:MAG: hypothetical protein QW839_05820, partial [Conexivisphaerales archaeon]